METLPNRASDAGPEGPSRPEWKDQLETLLEDEIADASSDAIMEEYGINTVNALVKMRAHIDAALALLAENGYREAK